MLNERHKGRIYVIIQFIIILILLFICYKDRDGIGVISSMSSVIGLIIALMGFVFMIGSFISFRQTMTPNPVPVETARLITSGVYKFVRHPVYFSVLLSMLGVVIYVRSISGFLVWIVSVIFIIFKIKFEEANLTKKFPDYIIYTKKTKKLVPFLY